MVLKVVGEAIELNVNGKQRFFSGRGTTDL